jgi:hypothetical protein
MKPWILISIVIIGVVAAIANLSVVLGGGPGSVPPLLTVLSALCDVAFIGLFVFTLVSPE